MYIAKFTRKNIAKFMHLGIDESMIWLTGDDEKDGQEQWQWGKLLLLAHLHC
jgi:hypothetical protein